MKSFISLALLAACVGATPAAQADPLKTMAFLVGNWNCTYQQGRVEGRYRGTFSFDFGGNWIRERDAWNGGGGDEGLFTYNPSSHTWVEIVVEQERAAVIFRGTGDGTRITYRSIYPDTSMTDVLVPVSPTRYELHFSQRVHGRTIASHDVCTKA